MKTIAIAAAAVAAVLASPVIAQERSVRVSYAGLDLASEKGQRVLQRRIASAVETVCGSYAATDTNGAEKVRSCRIAAMAGVDRQVERLAARTTGRQLAGR